MSPKPSQLVPFTSRLPAELIALIDERAALFNRSRAQEIHFLLKQALKGSAPAPGSTSPSAEQ